MQYAAGVPEWSLLTNHARVLLCIARDPGLRLRDIAATLGILAQAGYVIKQKDGRRNRYEIQAHLPLSEPGTRAPTIGEILALLLGDTGPTGPAGPDAADRERAGPVPATAD
jgi:DNA-binding transcriptional ArsR family regulator